MKLLRTADRKILKIIRTPPIYPIFTRNTKHAMWIFRFNQYIKNVFRLLAIIFIIIGHYIANWLTTGPLRKLFDPRGRRRLSRPERLRHIIEDLGPTFVKFGQILADRPDMVSESLRAELKKL
jgi:ubiquinone biosynthesis protein